MERPHYKEFKLNPGVSMMAMAASLARETTSKIATRVKNLLSQKEQQQQEQARNYWGRRKHRAYLRATHDGRKIAARVGRMTNWQNHQWMRNGMQDNRIDYFLNLVRPNRKICFGSANA